MRWRPEIKQVLAFAAIVILILLLRLPAMRSIVDLLIGTAWPITILIVAWWFRDQIKIKLGAV
jgi:hypothetical protein